MHDVTLLAFLKLSGAHHNSHNTNMSKETCGILKI